MIKDEERREVARRLREMDYADLQESLICAYLDALGIEGYEDWVGIAHRLADLIEPSCDRRAERTCNVKSSYVEWETGDYSYLEVKLSCGHDFTWDDDTPPDYCPYCGAKVVSDERD